MIERGRLLAALAPSLVHGFTTRDGGMSTGLRASLNLSAKWGDDPGRVAENRRRVARAGGFDPNCLRLVRQVHGAEVASVDAWNEATEADALVCTVADAPIVVGVLTADCVPVLLADRSNRVACAVHSGWRGTVLGIVGVAVERLARRGIPPGELVAAIGPCIEQRSFEVGREVAEQFPAAFVDVERFPRPHVDLVERVRSQLVEAGVVPEAIERVGGCSYADPERYFSYRRDGRETGQMLAFIGFTKAAAGGD
jgi:hypothetical protein